MWLAWLVACGAERGPQKNPEGDIVYSGYILAAPDAGDDSSENSGESTVFSDGTAEFTITSLEPILAEQPYPEQYPGYWEATVPPDTDAQLRLEGEGSYSGVWSVHTPPTAGSWYSGVLFGAEKSYMDAVFALLSTPIATQTVQSDRVQLWGVPADPEHWDCADIQVTHEGEASGTVHCLVFADDGSATTVSSGTFDWFLVTDLAPGALEVSHGNATESYLTQAGDVVMALWFVGGT